MSALPPVKPEGEDASGTTSAAVNTAVENSATDSNNHAKNEAGPAQSGTTLDDPYRYVQQPQDQLQQQPQQPQQQAQQTQQPGAQQQQPYTYYSYPPTYGQQYHYPYYQTNPMSSQNANAASTGAISQVQPGYNSNYADYSRVSYAQNYMPVYQNSVLNASSSGLQTGMLQQSNGAISAQVSAPTSSTITQPVAASTNAAAQYVPTNGPATTNAVGQVQPLGSRPRVTTTMWEDEKTLCYQVDANGVSVVRRADNNMINGTKLLNVAHITRGRRDGILKSEKVRDVVKIGSMHLKGVWIPFERALAMAQREGIVDLLYPLFVRDIKQVIQQGSTTQPQSNPVAQTPNAPWTYQQTQPAPSQLPQSSIPQPTHATHTPQQPSATQSQSQQPTPSHAQSTLQSTSQPQVAGQSQQPTKVSPYLTPNSLSNSSLPADSKQQAPQSLPQQQPGISQYTIPQLGSGPQHIQQGYYGSQYQYYPQYQYSGGYNSTVQGSTSTQASSTPYQYAQYGYGYAQQYQNPQFDDKESKQQ